MDMNTQRQPAASPRILIVDDDPGTRDVISEFLGRHGFTVETAVAGAFCAKHAFCARLGGLQEQMRPG